VGERRALVITSQCEGLNLLSFLPDAARDVANALLEPELGGCVPALADGKALLVDPTVAQLDEAITEAFARASEDEATLFIALVGHGEYTLDDFYFLTKETTLPPNSRTAFLLAQRIRELLAEYSLLDGLVLLLDTCHAGIAAEQAASRWIKIVGQAKRRFEVLTASDDRVAANGCFSKQLVHVLRHGHPKLGERLRCPDMKTVLAGLCPAQTAVHLAFDGRHEITAGDEGLWLAMNTSDAWRGSPAADNPASAEIDRLTRDFEPTPALGQLVGSLVMGSRYIAITGPPGSGKSKLIAALARPSVAEGILPPKLMQAVLFLSAMDTAERVAEEIARQLGKSVPGFADATAAFRASLDDAAWQAADAFMRVVLGPARALSATAPIRIAVDGLDDLPESVRARVRRALETLVQSTKTQIVLSSRDPLPAQATVWTSTFPVTSGPIGDPGSGPLRSSEGSMNPPHAGDMDVMPPPSLSAGNSLLDVLNAAGSKVHLPFTVLVAACAELNGPRTVAGVRDMLVQLKSTITRRNPGTPDETVARSTIAPPGLPEAHRAIALSLAKLAPVDQRETGGLEQLYADAAEPHHLWESGQKLAALESLSKRGPNTPADNCAVWEEWSRKAKSSEGEQSKAGIVAQARYLTSLGKAGNRALALEKFRALLPIARANLDNDDPEIFSIRNNIGYLLFELDQYDESRRELESLVAVATDLLSAEHEETLHAQHLIAVLAGKQGDGAESARLSLELLPVAERVLGPTSQVVTNAQLNYYFWTREKADPPDFLRNTATPGPANGGVEG
jgi:hypothetical protein